MAKRVVWTPLAEYDRIDVFTYWSTRNKSTRYSKELQAEIAAQTKLLAKNENIGRIIEGTNKRFLLTAKYYFIAYEVFQNDIIIHAFWDARQHPDKLAKRLR